jgi:hypothetical protein
MSGVAGRPRQRVRKLPFPLVARLSKKARLCLAIFAGTTDGDVFYSEDEGNHWQTIIKGIGAVSKSHHYINLSLEEQAAHH